jgi:hypothetical protein
MTAVVLRLPVVQTRPRTRGDCLHGERPCPHGWCRHHLPHPEHSCVLDEVDAGRSQSHPEIGAIFGWHRSRSYMLEQAATKKLARKLRDFEGTRISEAIGALAAVQSTVYDPHMHKHNERGPYSAADGWAVDWPLNAERIYELYEKASQKWPRLCYRKRRRGARKRQETHNGE